VAAVDRDLVGLAWRPELAAGILMHLDRLDVVEVMADDWFAAPRRRLRALRTLAAQVPVVFHGVSLGAASCAPTPRRQTDRLARVVNAAPGLYWSEHLAFVRAGGIEIGHLAAPPRTQATVDTACANLERASRAVGSRPLMENIATLVDPPGSRMAEADWIAAILNGSDCDMLLDLHNLAANAANFGFDTRAFLDAIPMSRVAAIHLAGGRLVRDAASGQERLLDDHLHDVPDPVFDLLAEVAGRSPRPLTVILERDGRYPPISELLAQLDRARAALRRGRLRRQARLQMPVAV